MQDKKYALIIYSSFVNKIKFVLNFWLDNLHSDAVHHHHRAEEAAKHVPAICHLTVSFIHLSIVPHKHICAMSKKVRKNTKK